MTATNLNLLRTTYPTRRPFVREITFVDGIGPPPFGWFDETQDHLGGIAQSSLGWSASIDSEEFEQSYVTAGYFGRMLVTREVGLNSIGPVAPVEVGEHGVWQYQANALPFAYTAEGARMALDGDFLLTAKVKIVSPGSLDTAELRGFVVGLGPLVGMGQFPCIACGGDKENWQALYSPDPSSAQVVDDTGIPCVAGRWYRLQISRVAGAVRFFVNGALARFASGLEGVYSPDRLLNARKLVEISRTNAGPANEGFFIDSLHLRAERVI